MRIFIILSLFILTSCSDSISNLPAPYNQLTEVLPYDREGWYGNGEHIKKLISKENVNEVIEVGCWLGKSTRHIAKHLPRNGKVYAVDHWLGSVEHQEGGAFETEKLPYLYDQFLSNVIHKKLTSKIIPIQMSSLEAEKTLSDVFPDLIYLDASHEYEDVYQDIVAWFPHVKGHGILCGDDYGWPGVKQAVHQFAEEHDLSIESDQAFWRFIE